TRQTFVAGSRGCLGQSCVSPAASDAAADSVVGVSAAGEPRCSPMVAPPSGGCGGGGGAPGAGSALPRCKVILARAVGAGAGACGGGEAAGGCGAGAGAGVAGVEYVPIWTLIRGAVAGAGGGDEA